MAPCALRRTVGSARHASTWPLPLSRWQGMDGSESPCDVPVDRDAEEKVEKVHRLEADLMSCLEGGLLDEYGSNLGKLAVIGPPGRAEELAAAANRAGPREYGFLRATPCRGTV